MFYLTMHLFMVIWKEGNVLFKMHLFMVIWKEGNVLFNNALIYGYMEGRKCFI